MLHQIQSIEKELASLRNVLLQQNDTPGLQSIETVQNIVWLMHYVDGLCKGIVNFYTLKDKNTQDDLYYVTLSDEDGELIYPIKEPQGYKTLFDATHNLVKECKRQ